MIDIALGVLTSIVLERTEEFIFL